MREAGPLETKGSKPPTKFPKCPNFLLYNYYHQHHHHHHNYIKLGTDASRFNCQANFQFHPAQIRLPTMAIAITTAELQGGGGGEVLGGFGLGRAMKATLAPTTPTMYTYLVVSPRPIKSTRAFPLKETIYRRTTPSLPYKNDPELFVAGPGRAARVKMIMKSHRPGLDSNS